MLYPKVESTIQPEHVIVGDNVNPKNVVLTRNVSEYVDEDGTKFYQYEEVRFQLPYDREETTQSVEENFNEWWIYGEEGTEDNISLEDRVPDLEELVISLLEV